jgi:hypothetical protein
MYASDGRRCTSWLLKELQICSSRWYGQQNKMPCGRTAGVTVQAFQRFLTKYILNLWSNLACRSGEIDPMLPIILWRGKTARKPSRINESLTNPLAVKSLSWLVINSSK